jgi:hypothetical protein
MNRWFCAGVFSAVDVEVWTIAADVGDMEAEFDFVRDGGLII